MYHGSTPLPDLDDNATATRRQTMMAMVSMAMTRAETDVATVVVVIIDTELSLTAATMAVTFHNGFCSHHGLQRHRSAGTMTSGNGGNTQTNNTMSILAAPVD